MAFVNISMLLGGLFVAIPIVIHLTMRRRPQRQLFPALQFLKERREANRKKLQLRHWLLLFLRCALVALLAAALARPSADSPRFGSWIVFGAVLLALSFVAMVLALAIVQRRGRWMVGSLAVACAVCLLVLLGIASAALPGGRPTGLGNQRAPVAAALVVDTSPRMAYRYENETRLEKAREMAVWVLTRLPRASEIAVVETVATDAHFSVDVAAAKKAVDRLEVSTLSKPIAETLRSAIALLRGSAYRRKELYVFTDLTKGAWPSRASELLRLQVEDDPELAIYVIDVGTERPRNRSLGNLQLSAEVVAYGSELTVTTELQGDDAKMETVDLFVETPDRERPVVVDGTTLLPPSVRRDQVSLELTAGTGATNRVSVGWATCRCSSGIGSAARRRWVANRRRPLFRRRCARGLASTRWCIG